ncbi:MAG: hypothetical protein KTR13_08780 [Saprospiraceae bacterium]|nr:hypothetical protein [Saprospiraceae bacterium]
MNLLAEYPLLLLFVVASLGYLIGTFKIKGSSLGVAAVLFTGLAFGAMNPEFKIPEIIFQLGLSIFVYSIGLSSGPAFFDSYRKNGIRDFLFITSILVFTGVAAAALALLLDFSAATITGVYTGSTTNTAALAGVIDYIGNTFPANESSDLLQDTVVGYTFSYPMGVLGGMIAIVIMERLLKIDYEKEAEQLRKIYPVGNRLTSASIRITQENQDGKQLRDLFKEYSWNVTFGRLKQDGKVNLSEWSTVFNLGDEVMVVGAEDDIDEVVKVLGERVKNSSLAYDREQFDVSRIFVSNPAVAGKTLASLNIPERYNALVTRIRRGDVDMLATGSTVLELGDRIRFIARREDLKDLSAYFGDSYQESSKVNLFSFGLGIGLGLLLGSINFKFGPDFSFKLGYAGGPLIIGLLLGTLRRTGRIVWTLPFSANVTLQQMGLILLLSAIGVRSGNAFIQSLSSDGFVVFGISAVLSLLTAFITLFAGFKLLKIPFSLLMGMVANQPAILDFATSRSNNRLPQFGFAMMFPLALIFKIIIAQILFIVLA